MLQITVRQVIRSFRLLLFALVLFFKKELDFNMAMTPRACLKIFQVICDDEPYDEPTVRDVSDGA